LPPGSPPAAVNALRTAVARVEQDPAFIAEATKVLGDVPEYVTGPNLNVDVQRALTISPELRKFMEDYTKRAN
jgi:hypothetical protein